MPDPNAVSQGEFAAQPEGMPAGEGGVAPREGGERGSDGDPRRRRRGRRGGRRNRRDRDDRPEGGREFGGAPESGAEFGQDSISAPQGWQDRVPAEAAPSAEPAYAARPETMTSEPQVTQPAPAPAPAEAPQRRRSTVREAAPTAGGSELPPMPVPPPQAEPAPVVTSSDSGEAKPRRTGWWARKLLGGKD